MKYFKLLLLFSAIKLVAQDPAIIPKTEDSLKVFLQTYPKDTVYVRALRPYALIQLNKHADYEKADSVATVILRLSKKLNYGRGIYFHYMIKASIHHQKSEAMLALENFKKCYETVKKYKLNVSLEEASLNNIAIGYEQMGNKDKALDYALRAIKVQEKPDYPTKWLDSGPYGTVSGIYKFQKKLKEALKYAQQAFEIAQKKQELINMAITKNKIGNIYDDMNLPEKALQEYRTGLKLAEESGYQLLQTDLLTNVGRMLTDLKRYDEAEKYLKKNEALGESLESAEALNTAYINLGNLYKAKGNRTLAIKYFEKSYLESKKIEDAESKYKSAKLLSEEFSEAGDFKKGYQFLLESNSAKDSLYSQESDAKMQELLTQFETEKKEAAINQLKLEKKEANNRLIILGILAVLALISGILIFSNYKSKQKIKALESTQVLRNKISADLHDEIGSTLSSISILSEMLSVQPKIGSNPEIMLQISNDARKVIEKMDEIIWAINPENDEFLNLEARIKSYAVPILENKGIDFNFEFSADLESQNIGMEKRKDIYLILKEAINNAIKYSACKNLSVTGNLEGGYIKISVKDDGKGFESNKQSLRNGLKNMQKRAETIGGKLMIQSELSKGTEIVLNISNR